jgi:xanthine dehydrogenase YagR molybdenum-binding subunit
MGDTDLPFGPGSGGSCTAASLAPTARNAAFELKQKLFAAVAKRLGARPEELGARDGKIVVTAAPSRALPFAKAAARLRGKLSVIATRGRDYEAFRDKMGGVQIAEVEVDTRTGQVRVPRVTVVQDFGRPIDRLTAESQINGGVIQGVSYALLEARRMDRHAGRMVNPDLESYKIATANDCPEIDVAILDVANGGNSTGTVGLGEPPTVPTAAAIANAVYNAIGVRIHELPITPDRVLAALAAKGTR